MAMAPKPLQSPEEKEKKTKIGPKIYVLQCT
jgi:hypothetical protein